MATWGWIIFGVAYIAYWCWSCAMPSTKYLQNSVELQETYKAADTAIKSTPEIVFHIECYHFETHVVHETDGEGNSRTRTETRKVVTYRGSRHHTIKNWIDKSPPSYTLGYLEHIHCARLYTDKEI